MPAMLIQAEMVSAPAQAFIRDELKVERYWATPADLNGDGAEEIIVRAETPRFCGSGGCTLFVLSPHAGTYRVVTRMTITRPPIRVLATSTRGWRDLSVRVGGGGIVRAVDVRLRFDGQSYPSSPTSVPPRRR